MPIPKRGPHYLIRNTEKRPDSGHWYALYVDAAGDVHYYDSFSKPLSFYTKTKSSRKMKQADTSDREQLSIKGFGDSVEETTCGQLAMTWLALVQKAGIEAAMTI